MIPEQGAMLLNAACEIALKDDCTRSMMQSAIDAADRGATDEALQQLKSLLAANPRYADAAILQGSLLLHEKGQRALAVRSFSHALRHDPNSALALSYLALDAMARGGGLPTALGLLDVATKAEPADSFCWVTLAWLIAALGRGAQASSLLGEQLTRSGEWRICTTVARAVAASGGLGVERAMRGDCETDLRCLVELAGVLPGMPGLGAECLLGAASGGQAVEMAPLGHALGCRHAPNPALSAYRRRFGARATRHYVEQFLQMILRPEIHAEIRRREGDELPRDLLKLRGRVKAPADMVEIPAGDYVVGAPNANTEHPRKVVPLRSFLIDRHPVTNGQWREFLPDHKFPKGQEAHPVVGVDFVQATLYARWRGKRLPTEEEWEAAARGTEGTPFPWGVAPDPARANCRDRRSIATTPVTAHPGGASPFDVRDMMGNAQEWVDTWHAVDAGGELRRIAKGGGFSVVSKGLQCWVRAALPPHTKHPHVGLRCAMDF